MAGSLDSPCSRSWPALFVFFFTLSIAHSLACFPLYHTLRQVAWCGSFCSWLLSLGRLASLLGMARFVLGFFRLLAWLASLGLAASPACLVGSLCSWLLWLGRLASLLGMACFVLGFFCKLACPLTWLGWLASFLGMARFVLGFSRLLAWLASLGLAGSPARLVWLALFLASFADSLGWLHLVWLARQLAWYGSICSCRLSLTRSAGFTWLGSLCSFCYLGFFVRVIYTLAKQTSECLSEQAIKDSSWFFSKWRVRRCSFGWTRLADGLIRLCPCTYTKKSFCAPSSVFFFVFFPYTHKHMFTALRVFLVSLHKKGSLKGKLERDFLSRWRKRIFWLKDKSSEQKLNLSGS